MGETQGKERWKGRGWALWAPLVTAAVLCAMAACFARGQLALRPMALLPEPEAWVSPAPAQEAIDLNTASLEDLDTLPGIGPARAQAIVDWREEHGPFRYPEELIYVPGIGEGILEDLLDLVTVGG